MKDPELLAKAARQKLVINPVSGKKIAELLDRVYATPQQLLDRVTRFRQRTRTRPRAAHKRRK